MKIVLDGWLAILGGFGYFFGAGMTFQDITEWIRSQPDIKRTYRLLVFTFLVSVLAWWLIELVYRYREVKFTLLKRPENKETPS